MKTEKYYKILNDDGSTPQGYGKWDLPKGDEPGEWTPKLRGTLIPCEYGYHVLRAQDILSWLDNRAGLYEVETKYKPVFDTSKVVVQQARTLRKIETYNPTTLRLFAADCAEHVLHIFESQYPNDDRPRKAIEAARRFASGGIGGDELEQARRAAANAAANAADAAYAAYAAANAAAYAADTYAAVRRTQTVERKWQVQHLAEMLGIV